MINYIKGDATSPITSGKNCIVHVCNDIGKWGKGFVLALSNKWPQTRVEYLRHSPYRLGDMHYVPINPELVVCNMIAQHGIYHTNGVPPIRYDALSRCLSAVSLAAEIHKFTIHMPRIGCGLAGGEWNKVEEIIKNCIKDKNIEVYVYDLK